MESLVVALGQRRYRVLRPWADLPPNAGKVTDVTADSSGQVYVLTRRDHPVEVDRPCVHIFTSKGRHIGAFGEGRVIDAHMIAADAQDRLWVVDRDAHEIVAFSSSGVEITQLGGRHRPLEPFNHPSDIAFGPDGGLWVADGYAAGRIHGFDRAGHSRIVWGDIGTGAGHFLTAHGIWVTRDNRVIVADRENHRVQVFSAQGDLLTIWRDFHRPSDIWGDAQDNLFICDGVPTLTMIDASGHRLGRCRPVQSGAHGIWGDAAGRIYLAEGTPSRITVLEPII